MNMFDAYFAMFQKSVNQYVDLSLKFQETLLSSLDYHAQSSKKYVEWSASRKAKFMEDLLSHTNEPKTLTVTAPETVKVETQKEVRVEAPVEAPQVIAVEKAPKAVAAPKAKIEESKPAPRILKQNVAAVKNKPKNALYQLSN